MKNFVIKVCGITRRQDAEAAVAAGANALGFVFHPKSPRVVTPEEAAALGEGLNVLKVGIFVDESADETEKIMREAKLDIAQVYKRWFPDSLESLSEEARSQLARRVWLAVRFPLPPGFGIVVNQGCEATLFDGAKNGATFDWRLVRDFGERFLVAGGLDASNVGDAIRQAQPWGVDASSKLESTPGIKDHEKMRAYVKAAQEAYAHI